MVQALQVIGGYIAKGGWMMIPLMVLAFVLFTSLFSALMNQWFAWEGETAERAAFDQRLRILKVLTSVAPLLGLLGTIAGMLKTFRGLSSRGISLTEDLVAVGISEALVTTQLGLSIGVIGLAGIMVYGQFHQKNLLREYRNQAACIRFPQAESDT